MAIALFDLTTYLVRGRGRGGVEVRAIALFDVTTYLVRVRARARARNWGYYQG